jgi:hypothetical protein
MRDHLRVLVTRNSGGGELATLLSTLLIFLQWRRPTRLPFCESHNLLL